MPKPRNRKPVAIPSLPPVARVAGAPHGDAAMTTLHARVLARAGTLLRPRGDRPVVHRRLVDRRSESSPAAAGAPGDPDAGPARAFRGATARFVALG
jgi:hypothetical protein